MPDSRTLTRLAFLFCLIATLAVCNNAYADILVTGGTQAERQAVFQAYRALPSCCCTSCSISVHLLDRETMDAYIRTGLGADASKMVAVGAVDGIYQDGLRTITLCPSRCANTASTFAHEYGHYVWDTMLTNDQRSRYAEIYKQEKADHSLISNYAYESVTEGFAESFATFVTQTQSLADRDPASDKFICDCMVCSKG